MKSAIAVPKVVESQTKSSTDKTVSRRSAPGTNMDQAAHNKIVSFLWGIADDVLRDLFKRGKYPDVILLACTRFRRHRVRCFDGAGGGSWRDGSLRESSSLRPCA